MSIRWSENYKFGPLSQEEFKRNAFVSNENARGMSKKVWATFLLHRHGGPIVRQR